MYKSVFEIMLEVLITNNFISFTFFMIKVAVMDIDICGPSAPRIMGVEGETGKRIIFVNLY